MNSLQFLVDINARLKGGDQAASTLQKIDNLLHYLDPGLVKTRKGAYALGYALGTVGKSAMAMGRAVRAGLGIMGVAFGAARRVVGEFASRTLAHLAALATWDGLKALGRKAWSLGQELLEVADKADRTERIFRAMMDAPQAEGMLAYAKQMAGVLDHDSAAVQRLTLGLVKAGMAAHKLPASLALAADVAALAEEPAEAFAQVGKMLEQLEKGRPLKLNALEALPGFNRDRFMSGLAEKTGHEISKLKKLLAKGDVDIGVIQQQMQETVAGITGKAPGEAGLAAGASPFAKIRRAGRLPGDFFEEMAKSPGLIKLGDAFERITKAFDPSTPTGQAIKRGMDSMLTAVADALGKIDLPALASSLETTFKLIPPLIEKAVVLAEKLFGLTNKALDALNAFRGNASEKDKTKSGAAKVGAGVRGVGQGLENATADMLGLNAKERSGGFFNTMGALAHSAITLGNLPRKLSSAWDYLAGNSTDAFANKLEGGQSRVQQAAATGIGEAAKKGATTALEVQSPSKVFERLGRYSTEGYARGLEASEARVGKAVARTLDVAEAPQAEMGSPARGGIGRGAVSISIPITVNVDGGGSEGLAQEIAERVRDLVPSQLANALAQLQVEAGIA